MLASPWLGRTPLLLASKSLTRRQLLEDAALPVEMVAPEVDERALEATQPGLSPVGLALALAEAKANAVATRYPRRVVIGADQVLDLDGRIFHKPTGPTSAREQLRQLTGRTHSLHSAVALRGSMHDSFVDTARLTLRPLDDRAIAAYVECMGDDRIGASVGGYQLEGLGIHLFEHIAGDHSAILGLPLLPLLSRLRTAGLLRF